LDAALVGLAATVVAALLALVGVLRTGKAPGHLADAQAWAALLDELRTELARKDAELAAARRERGDDSLRRMLAERQSQLSDCQRRLAECWADNRALRRDHA
jgi:proteasome assembly chaperone (PAC2) family protein